MQVSPERNDRNQLSGPKLGHKVVSSLDKKPYIGNTVEVYNFAYSKFENNGGLFPPAHYKRGHLKSFKKLQTITATNSPPIDSSNQ
jgi:hypothetical protein